MRRDIDALREQRFDYAILDEAQAIKNEGSRTAKAARSLRAEHRLALTGTPIENHLGELASLYAFLNPGLLGRARGHSPLWTGTRDPDQAALLARGLRPVLLRRTKSEVLRELPAKTEQTLLCELLPVQRRQYDELRRHYQRVLSERVAKDGIERSKLHVLEALLRLRQSACHPALIDRDRVDEPSAKLETLFEQLEEVLAEGHKALVFSQFTRLLALVRTGVEARGIGYAYLDGRTRDRPARIERFQHDPTCQLFLVSLKAGGTGLNLTAADYVYLLDPWWNPAVEAQAIDRAHRIGQPRPVFAYRLVACDTVEEKILAMQQQKRALAATILGAGEQSLIGSLSAEDLRALLS
jgi:SNF2 family DNA or RNA helicase